MYFKHRKEAGQRLAEVLAGKYAAEPGVVYALPRGGVVLGAEIAQRLRLPLDLVIARKIGHPHNPEYAIAAVTEGGEPVSNTREQAQLGGEWFRRQVELERREARRRHEVYLGARGPLSPADKTAILVDDGIATGLTMEAAIREMQRHHAKRIVVAVPVIPPDTATRLAREVDDVVALDVPADYFGAVGAYYVEFPQVTDEEVVAQLRDARAAEPPA